MSRSRQIIGLLALSLASVGPMPLWLHHDQCHELHFHAHRQNDPGGEDAHAGCRHAASGCQQNNSNQVVPTSTSSQVNSHAQAAHEHDCLICFQLSQASTFQLVEPVAEVPLAAVHLVGGQPQFYSTWSLGLYGTRAPPLV